MAQPPQRSNPPATGKGGAPAPNSAAGRRNFMAEFWAVLCGTLAVMTPVVSGLVVYLNPLTRKRVEGALVPVAPLEAVPDDGVPRQFPVVAERVDAWNRSLEPIGAVYLRRQPGESKIECLTATCPHAGCFVSYDGTTGTFKCPCHNSQFAIDGAIIPPSPSPRAMDTLDCEVRDSEVLVKFEDFYSGRTDKVVKG